MARKNLVILGSSGQARETLWLIRELNRMAERFTFLGFVVTNLDELRERDSRHLVIGDYDWLHRHRSEVDAALIGIGDPAARVRVARQVSELIPNVEWPSVIHPGAIFDRESTAIGEGAQISAGFTGTVNLTIGPFALCNFGCTVGHEATIGRGSVINPGANISGGVIIGREVLVGTGAQVLQYINVGDGAIVGAGAVVTKDVAPGTMVVGVPAKPKPRRVKDGVPGRRCLAAGSNPVVREAKHAIDVYRLSTNQDAERWDRLVRGALGDVYYLADYGMAHENSGMGKATGLVVSAGSHKFLIPLLVRPLAELEFATESKLFDAITPYGYGGVLQLTPGDADHECIREMVTSVGQWCRENSIVSLLLRLHPLLDQAKWFEHIGDVPGLELRHHGPTCALDLSTWDDARDCIAGMKKKRRLALNRGRGLTVRWGSDVNTFRIIYEHTMARLSAREMYFFSEGYYERLLKAAHPEPIIIASLGDIPVAAAWFMVGPHYAHYHLSGATGDGNATDATTLLLNEAARRARGEGCALLHLGGGTQGEDSLFRFKASFGGRVCRYSFVSLIAMREEYESLVARRQAATPDDCMIDRQYFPLYRG